MCKESHYAENTHVNKQLNRTSGLKLYIERKFDRNQQDQQILDQQTQQTQENNFMSPQKLCNSA